MDETGNFPSSGKAVYQNAIKEALNEEMSQEEAWAWAQMSADPIPALPAMMSSMQTDQNTDLRWEVEDAVGDGDDGNPNEDDENENKDVGDMVNHAHGAASQERKVNGKTRTPHKRKGLSNDLDPHLATFLYNSLLANNDSQNGCWRRVLDHYYGNYRLSQYLATILTDPSR